MKKIILMFLLIISLTSCSKSLQNKIYMGKEFINNNELKLFAEINDNKYILDSSNFYEFCNTGSIDTKDLKYNLLMDNTDLDINKLSVLSCDNKYLLYENGGYKYIVEPFLGNKSFDKDLNNKPIKEIVLLKKETKYKNLYKIKGEKIYNAVNIAGETYYLDNDFYKIIDIKGVKYGDFGKIIKGKGILYGNNGKINFVSENGDLMFGKKNNISDWPTTLLENKYAFIVEYKGKGYIISKINGKKVETIENGASIFKLNDNMYLLSEYRKKRGFNLYFYNIKTNTIVDFILNHNSGKFKIVVSNKYIFYIKFNDIYGISSDGNVNQLSNNGDLDIFSEPKFSDSNPGYTKFDLNAYNAVKKKYIDKSLIYDYNSKIRDFNKIIIEGKYKRNLYNIDTKDYVVKDGEGNFLFDKDIYYLKYDYHFFVVDILTKKYSSNYKGHLIYKENGDNKKYSVGKKYETFIYKNMPAFTYFLKDGEIVPILDKNFKTIGKCKNKSEYYEYEREKRGEVDAIFFSWSYSKGKETVSGYKYKCVDEKTGKEIVKF